MGEDFYRDAGVNVKDEGAVGIGMGGARSDRESCGESRSFEEALGWRRVEREIWKTCRGKTKDGSSH